MGWSAQVTGTRSMEALIADPPTFIAARVTGDRPAATTHRDPV
jgi:hypothetical protein